MKKTISVLYILFMVGFISAQDITSGLIAHYSFNGNFNDTSGNSYHMTNSGVTFTSDRFGNPNKAGNFNGSSNYLKSQDINDTVFSNSQLTISSWVKFAGNQTSDARVVAIGKSGTYWQNCIQAFLGGSSKIVWFGTDGVGSYSYYDLATNPLNANEWHQVTNVIDLVNDSSWTYINGVLTLSASASAFSTLHLNNGNETIMIGASVGAGNYFNGNIDDARIYKRALTSNDAKKLYITDTTKATNLNIEVSLSNSTRTNNQLSIYPNPNNGSFKLKSTSFGMYNIINQLGQVVQQIKLNTSNSEVSVDNLDAGVYFIVNLENSQYTNQKFVVIK